MPYTTSRSLAAAVAVIAAVTVAIIGATALPAAAQTAGFGDVPQTAYYAAPVADLDAKGVFNGTLCEDGFCPWKPIDRKTMAVWIVRVLDGQDPSPITRSRFNDVDPASFHARFIERMAELEVTSGCGDGSGFCPDRTVSRAEMAAFFSRAYDLPPGPDPGFSDVPGDAWYTADVEKFAAAGITVGCGGGMFCPSGPTTRGQMATFLHRAEQNIDDTPIAVERVVLEAPYVPLAEVSVAFEQLGHPELAVHYCGPRSNYDLAAAVSMLNSVDRFFQHQSGLDADGEPKTRISFTTGQVVSPGGIVWTNLLSSWLGQPDTDGFSTNVNKCRGAAGQRHDRNVLILVDVPWVNPVTNSGVVGFAYPDGGPAVAIVGSRANDSIEYLGTIAHELAHGYYNFNHPWTDYKQLYATAQMDCNKLVGAEITECMSHRQDTVTLTTEEVDHLLKSIMSYNAFGAIDDFAQGYFACYHRLRAGWIEASNLINEDDCLDAPPVPDAPRRPTLNAQANSISVSWNRPAAHDDAPITGYVVRYRAVGEAWSDWPHDDDSLFTEITGLAENTRYEVRLRAQNRIGRSEWSQRNQITTLETDGEDDRSVILRVGDSAAGEPTSAGPCAAQCRWLHVELINFEPGTYTLACAHNGVSDIGASRGVYRSATVSSWPATRSCLFGYPGSEVFVIVDATRGNDGIWRGGVSSVPVEWPDCVAEPQKCGGDRQLRISWGSDASNRRNCPANTECRNLGYEYIGNWGDPPYDVECWANGHRGDRFLWTGRPHTGCYYWSSDVTAQVVIDGVRSNVLQWEGSLAVVPDQPTVRATVSGTTVGASWSADDNGSRIDKWEIGGVGEVSATTTSYAWSNQAPGAYAVRVRAYNAHGWSEWGTSNTVTVNGNVPTLAVRRGGPAVAGSCTSTSGCEWVHGSGSGWTPGAQFWVKCGDFVDTSRNIPVVYANRYVDSNGNLSWGDRICLSNFEHSVEVWTNSDGPLRTIIPAPTTTVAEVPDQPSVRATVSGTTVEASWSADDNGSRIDKWEIGGVGEVSATTTSYAWSNQAPSAYAVRVRAHNAEGWSAWATSNTVTVTSQTGPPDAPSVRATVSGTTVGARWSADDNGSRIDKWEIGGVGEVSATTTSYAWSNQAPGAYAVRVRAHNAEGWSAWAPSNTVTVTPSGPTLNVRRGGPAVAGSCTSTSGCEWVHGSGSGWTPGAQFWVKCGDFVDTSRNIPVVYANRYVDSNGNLSWGDRICLSNFEHSVEVWTNSDGPLRTIIPAPGG